MNVLKHFLWNSDRCSSISCQVFQPPCWMGSTDLRITTICILVYFGATYSYFGATYLYVGATYYDNNLLHLDPMVWKMLVPPTIWGHNRLKIAALDAEENIIKVLYNDNNIWDAVSPQILKRFDKCVDNLCCWQFWRRWAHSMRWVGGNRIQGGPSVPAHRIQYKPPRPQQRCKKQFE